MTLWTFKIIAVVFVFAVGLVGGKFSFKLAESENSKRWFSMAAGTFLYVSILGIAHEEFADHTDKMLKFICLGAGIALMSLVAIWT